VPLPFFGGRGGFIFRGGRGGLLSAGLLFGRGGGSGDVHEERDIRLGDAQRERFGLAHGDVPQARDRGDARPEVFRDQGGDLEGGGGGTGDEHLERKGVLFAEVRVAGGAGDVERGGGGGGVTQERGGGGGVGQVRVGDMQFLGGGDVHVDLEGEAQTERLDGDGQ